MKKLAAVLFVIIISLLSVSISEETVSADASEGSRLIGLLITRENLVEHTGESGILLASCTQKKADHESEYHFGDVSGLRFICFLVPEDSGEGNQIISNNEEFDPGTVPEQIVPLAETEYLLLETVEKDPDGGSFTRREAVGRDMDSLNTFSCRDDGICLSHYHEVLWEGRVNQQSQ